ncbi:hypothetical protein ABE454_05180 [Brevundimonas diminuta]
MPFADADGFSDFQKIDPLSARYVEIYRGGNVLRFGGTQLGGAINFVTPTGRTAQFDNLLRIEGGSFDTYRGQVAVAQEAGKGGLTYCLLNNKRNLTRYHVRHLIYRLLALQSENRIRLLGKPAFMLSEVPSSELRVIIS